MSHPSGGQQPGDPYGQGAPQYPPPPYGYPPAVPGTNGMAIAALIVSLVSCGPVGLILGIISLKQIKKSGEQGRGMALAGTIIGAIGTVAWIALIVFWVWLFVYAANNDLNYDYDFSNY